jgi:hyperosmotically inducible protein
MKWKENRHLLYFPLHIHSSTGDPMNKKLKLLAGVALLALVAAASMGCGKKGPAEKAGEKIDEGIESAKDKAKDMVEEKGPLEKAGEKADSLMDEAGDALESE